MLFGTCWKICKNRLSDNKVILNLAHPDKPKITRTDSDQNVQDLDDKIAEALNKIRTLDLKENNNVKSARYVWDWVFKTDGYFAEYDNKRGKVEEKANLILTVAAYTTPAGRIGYSGVKNQPHNFDGEVY